MKSQFVTHEIALQLKELGFDNDCLMIWEHTDFWTILVTPDSFKKTVSERYCKAPLYQQVTQWLREKHNIYITIHVHKEGYSFNIQNLKGKHGIEMIYSSIISSMVNDIYYKTYEESVKNSIEYTLNLLK